MAIQGRAVLRHATAISVTKGTSRPIVRRTRIVSRRPRSRHVGSFRLGPAIVPLAVPRSTTCTWPRPPPGAAEGTEGPSRLVHGTCRVRTHTVGKPPGQTRSPHVHARGVFARVIASGVIGLLVATLALPAIWPGSPW